MLLLTCLSRIHHQQNEDINDEVTRSFIEIPTERRNKMKILMLTPYLPYPPSEGGQLRSYKLIKLLSRRHEITLVCFSRQHNTPDQVDHMRKYCRKVIV